MQARSGACVCGLVRDGVPWFMPMQPCVCVGVGLMCVGVGLMHVGARLMCVQCMPNVSLVYAWLVTSLCLV